MWADDESNKVKNEIKPGWVIVQYKYTNYHYLLIWLWTW